MHCVAAALVRAVEVACLISCHTSTLHPSRAHRSIYPRPAPACDLIPFVTLQVSVTVKPSVIVPSAIVLRHSDTNRSGPKRSDPIACTPSAPGPPSRSDPQRSDPQRSDHGSLGPPARARTPLVVRTPSLGPNRSDPIARTPLPGLPSLGPPLLGPPLLRPHCSPPHHSELDAWTPIFARTRSLGPRMHGNCLDPVTCACACCRPPILL